MKRRTTRQIVGQLADLRHSARCSALRAAATSKTMMQQGPSEHDGQPVVRQEAVQDGLRQDSFVGAAHDRLK
jgi:hypothetical protein